MAINSISCFTPATVLKEDNTLPIFDIQRVQLQFSISASFVAAQVANNVLILALSNGRILRIDLNHPEDIDDVDLPKKPSEVGVIQRMFLDPTASHLIISTALSENYYLHYQSRQPRPLARLRGISIRSVAWNPQLPAISSREILIGTADGKIYETYLETSAEFYRKEEKYLKFLVSLSDGPISGLWLDYSPVTAESDQYRRIIASTSCRLLCWTGKVGRSPEGGASIYSKIFDVERPVMHELTPSISSQSDFASQFALGLSSSALVVSASSDPHKLHEDTSSDRAYAWLSHEGVLVGKLLKVNAKDLGVEVFLESKNPSSGQITSSGLLSDVSGHVWRTELIEAIALTEWHVISVIGSRLVAVNRLTGFTVFDQIVLDQEDKLISLCVDMQKSTYWLVSSRHIFEIVIQNEDRDIWKIMLQQEQFGAAMQFAQTTVQHDTVATASGDHLISKGLFIDASVVYGNSNKPFEDVALVLIDENQPDALRQYLLTKLQTYKRLAVTQRILISSWLVEVFMFKMNSLDDSIRGAVDSARIEAANNQLRALREEFQSFVVKNKGDFDNKTVYEIISSHGREEELLFYADKIDDGDYVLSYWVQREKWTDALAVLKRQTDMGAFYRYSGVLMAHVAQGLVDVLIQQGGNIEPRSIIPALLEYDTHFKGPLTQNQAIRYLQFVVNQLQSTDAAVHNATVAILAAQPSSDESALLAYLESQGDELRYDTDFALRLCIQHQRVLSCVHIYTGIGQYVQAVDLALTHDAVELAAAVADRPMGNILLRKRLWLAVARKVIIQQSHGTMKTAIDFLKRSDVLEIEDLVLFFPDFVVIDDFKHDICSALEGYSLEIDDLKKEMDDSTQTEVNIRSEIAALDYRYAIVEPGEKCSACELPLLSRQFFVFPCQHAFHSDCLGRCVLEQSNLAVGKKIKELQVHITKGFVSGLKKDAMIADLDALVASAW